MAIELDYMPLESEELPVEKIFDLGNEYTFEFIYNERIDRITMYIKDEDDNILYSTLIVYGSKLYHAVVDGIDIDQNIYAFDINDLLTEFTIENTSVNFENIGTVKLYLIDE